MDDMNDSNLWAQGSRWYEEIIAMDHMNDSESWKLCSRSYE